VWGYLRESERSRRRDGERRGLHGDSTLATGYISGVSREERRRRRRAGNGDNGGKVTEVETEPLSSGR
jgi:hypothetical protein